MVRDLAEMGVTGYASKPDRGRRRWKGKEAEHDAGVGEPAPGPWRAGQAYAAESRRVSGATVRTLLRDRRSIRRTHPRGYGNFLKRALIHLGTCNLSLLIGPLFGVGTPRGAAESRGVGCVGRRTPAGASTLADRPRLPRQALNPGLPICVAPPAPRRAARVERVTWSTG